GRGERRGWAAWSRWGTSCHAKGSPSSRRARPAGKHAAREVQKNECHAKTEQELHRKNAIPEQAAPSFSNPVLTRLADWNEEAGEHGLREKAEHRDGGEDEACDQELLPVPARLS